jgi:serine/threonine protein kinase
VITDQLATTDASTDKQVSGLIYDAFSNQITYGNDSITRLDLQFSTSPFCLPPLVYTNDRINKAFSHVESNGDAAEKVVSNAKAADAVVGNAEAAVERNDSSNGSLSHVENNTEAGDERNESSNEALSFFENNTEAVVKDSFLEMMLKLDHGMVKAAMDWVSSKAVQISEADSFGEMFFQQIVYSPFAALFMAASAERYACYAADQEVHSSLSVLGRVKRDGTCSPKSITIRPDSAVTLGAKRDALGLMEIKADHSNKAGHKVDKDRCVLVTAATARVLYRLKPDWYEKVVLPFVIANGPLFGLFVTRLHENGTPYVSYIRLLDGETLQLEPFYSCERSPNLARSKMFVALAVILDDLRSLLDKNMLAEYKQMFQLPFVGDPILSGPPSKRHKSGPKDEDDSTQNASGPKKEAASMPSSYGPSEDDAMEAASCGGIFVALRCAFLHTLRFGDESDEEEERPPPYFFIGTEAATRQAVFVKAWPVSKTKLVDVQTEWALHNQAHAAGVSVARPLDPQVIQVHSSTSGSLYVMIVMEYIPRKPLDQNSDTLLAFAVSLIETVHKLHSAALILHCDLSPANVIWNGKQVVLIDFGRAQPTHKAHSECGTKGFEAPELLEGKPHAPGTDAFSVGEIILFWLEKLGTTNWNDDEGKSNVGSPQVGLFRLLNAVAIGLTKADPSERWDLERALGLLTKQAANVCLESDHKALPSPPPSKIAKYSSSNHLCLEQAAH